MTPSQNILYLSVNPFPRKKTEIKRNKTSILYRKALLEIQAYQHKIKGVKVNLHR